MSILYKIKNFLVRERKALYFRRGEMAEWSIAAVLKTVEG